MDLRKIFHYFYLLTFIYWRSLWQGIALLVLLILPAFTFFAIKHINVSSREKKFLNHLNNENKIKSWTRKEVLRDYKFYTILPCLLASPFVITGIVINQSFILESKNWGDYVLAKAFMSYSFFTVITLFISGFLVDRFTSRNLLIYLNLPMILSLIVLIFFDHSYSAFIFMGFMGISNGLTNVLISSFWAEIYGVNYLGSIKALTGSLMVFSTALATTVFGVLIDLGYSIENIAFLCAIYTAISIIIVILCQKYYKPILIEK